MTDDAKYKVIRILIVFVTFVLFGFMFLPFFTPIMMAALFGFALEPVVSKYAARKSKRMLPTAILLFSFFLLITGPLVWLLYRLVDKVKEFSVVGFQNLPLFKSLETAYNRTVDSIWQGAERLNIDAAAAPDQTEWLAKGSAWFMNYLTNFIAGLPQFVLALFVFTAALYYFLTESSTVKRALVRLNLLSGREITQIISVVQRSSYQSLIVMAAIGALQGLIVAGAAAAFGYPEFLIVFLVTFAFSFIPLLGTAPIPALLALVSFAQGEIGSGAGLLVAAVIAGSVDNVLKPIFLKGSGDELHPIISLLAIIGAIIVYGIPGLLLGPILTRLTFQIIPILFDHEPSNEASRS